MLLGISSKACAPRFVILSRAKRVLTAAKELLFYLQAKELLSPKADRSSRALLGMTNVGGA